MKNFIQLGNVVDLTAPAGGLASGQAHLFGALFGVSTKSANEGEKVAVSLEGGFALPKATALSMNEGDPAYWNETEITADSENDTLVGHVVEDAASAAATIFVRIKN